MVDYNDVNNSRYNKIHYENVEDNIYSAVNPIGNYSMYAGYKAARWFVQVGGKLLKKKIHDLSILDVGCGDGHITRIFVTLLNNADNVYGFDYSENNVNLCKSLNSSMVFEKGNVVEKIPFDRKFDMVSAFVVLSHLRKKEDVEKALMNINNALNENGLFLWYELVSKSHYINPDKDTQGFNEKELRELSEGAGFEEVARKTFSKTIWIGNRSRSLYYSAKENNIWFLELLSHILPLKPTITIRIYKKVSC